MSWFDYSLTFAKSTFNQAQKSIDKVLDISDAQSEVEGHDDSVTSSALLATPIITHSSNKPHPTAASATTIPSTNVSQQQQQQSSKPSQLQSKSSQKAAEKAQLSSSSNMFGSTWGSIDGYWNSSFNGAGAGGGGGGGTNRDKSKTSSEPVGHSSSSKGPAKQGVQSPKKPIAARNESSPSVTYGGESIESRSASLAVLNTTGDVASSVESVDGGSESIGSGKMVGIPTMTSTPLSASESRKDKSSGDNSRGSGGSSSKSPPPTSSSPPPTSSSPPPTSSSPPLKNSRSTEEELKEAVTDTESPLPPSCESIPVHPSVEGGVATGDQEKNAETQSLPSRQKIEEKTADLKGASEEQAVEEKVERSRESQISPSSRTGLSSKEDRDVEDSLEESREEKPEAGVAEAMRDSKGVVQSTGESSSSAEETSTNGRPHEAAGMHVGNDTSFVGGDTSSVSGGTSSVGGASPTADSEEEDAAVLPVKNFDGKESASLRQEGGSGKLEKPASTKENGEGVGDSGGRELKEEDRESEAVKAEEVARGEATSAHQLLTQELEEVRRVLAAREKKMVSMSEELMGLMERNQSLQEELQEAREMSGSSMDELKAEFTKRISTAEKRLQTITRERDSLKKQVTAHQNEQSLVKKTEGEELSKILREKEEQISQLMEEGEKLSKQELQSNSIIRKLRTKERQNDQLIAAQRQQIEELEGKVKTTKEQVKKKDENERKYQESMVQLNTIAEQQSKELSQHKSEKDTLTEKVRSLQANLDNSYKELAEIQKTNAVSQSAAHEAAASAERNKQEELKLILEQQKMAAHREKESLLMQIEDLRLGVSRSEQQLAWKEDHMKQEVEDIRMRLQEAEDRNQELTATISQATKPLLRQIESLQSAHSAQAANWERVEGSLTQRLFDAQTQLNIAVDKERSAVERELTMKSKVNALDNHLGSMRQEKSQLQATVELERAKLETLEEGQHRDSTKLETLRASFQQTVDELRKEKDMMERQLEYERVRLEAESRKANLESQEKERLRSQLMHSLNHSMSRQSSSDSQGEHLEKSVHGQSSEYTRGDSTSSDFFGHTHSARNAVSTSASALEKLQSMLKQKEGELANMQNLVSSLERSRAAMAEDLTTVSAEYEKVCVEVQQIPQLRLGLEEMEKKHEAILQMYGEKAEEAEELKLDIQDLKLMYRQQITELLGGKQ